MKFSIRFASIDSNDIVNLNDPSGVWKVFRHIGDWWNPKYDPLRVAIKDWYITLFDEANGHYEKLRKSIQRDGILNPLVITSGKPKYRTSDSIPPKHQKNLENLLSVETCGGSRLLIAQELNLKIPCFINDWNSRFSNEILILNREEIIQRLSDKTMNVNISDRGLEIKPITFQHMNDTSYNMSKQILTRRKILFEIVRRADRWLKNSNHLTEHERMQLDEAVKEIK